MGDREAKQRAIYALIAKFCEGLRLERVESLPQPVCGFDPEGWMLFYVNVGTTRAGAAEYVAIQRSTGKVRFLGELGE